MKKLFLSLLLLTVPFTYGQDLHNTCNGQTGTLLFNVPWASGNQVIIFSPIAPNASVYLFVHNNNPTSAHGSQTIAVYQTPDPFAVDLSNNADRWTQDTVTYNTTNGGSCNNVNPNNKTTPGSSGLGSCYVITMFAAQEAVNITGTALAIGRPDTVDLVVVQQNG